MAGYAAERKDATFGAGYPATGDRKTRFRHRGNLARKQWKLLPAPNIFRYAGGKRGEDGQDEGCVMQQAKCPMKPFSRAAGN